MCLNRLTAVGNPQELLYGSCTTLSRTGTALGPHGTTPVGRSERCASWWRGQGGTSPAAHASARPIVGMLALAPSATAEHRDIRSRIREMARQHRGRGKGRAAISESIKLSLPGEPY